MLLWIYIVLGESVSLEYWSASCPSDDKLFSPRKGISWIRHIWNTRPFNPLHGTSLQWKFVWEKMLTWNSLVWELAVATNSGRQKIVSKAIVSASCPGVGNHFMFSDPPLRRNWEVVWRWWIRSLTTWCTFFTSELALLWNVKSYVWCSLSQDDSAVDCADWCDIIVSNADFSSNYYFQE